MDFEIEYPEYPDFSTLDISSPEKVTTMSNLFQGSRTLTDSAINTTENVPSIEDDLMISDSDVETIRVPTPDYVYELNSSNSCATHTSSPQDTNNAVPMNAPNDIPPDMNLPGLQVTFSQNSENNQNNEEPEDNNSEQDNNGESRPSGFWFRSTTTTTTTTITNEWFFK